MDSSSDATEVPPPGTGEGRGRPEKHLTVGFGLRNLVVENLEDENVEEVVEDVIVDVKDDETMDLMGRLLNEDAIGDTEENDLQIVRLSALSEEDLDCLSKFKGRESWLNNDVVMCYLINELPKIDPNIMIVEIGIWKEKGLLQNLKTIFFPRYIENWNFIFVPIFINDNHWTLAIVNRNGNCDFYDSMGENMKIRQKEVIREILLLINVENIEFNEIDKETYYQQNNDHSCGPAVCMFAERFLRNGSLQFNHLAINNWRKKALKILRNEVLANQNQAVGNVDEMEVEKVSQQNSRKRRKPKLTLKREKLQRREENSNNYDNMSEEQRDTRTQKSADSVRERRIDPEVRKAEYSQINKTQHERRETAKLEELKDSLYKARESIDNEENVVYFDVGDMILECKHCKARFFKEEHVENTPKGVFDKCCKKGQIKELDKAFEDFPHEIYDLLAKKHGQGKKKSSGEKTLSELFHENPRNYNSSSAFASMKAQSWDKKTMPHAYRIQGQIYHTVNLALYPDLNEKPCYAQLFYMDTEEAVKERMEHGANKACSKDVMEVIDRNLHDVNPYYDSLKMMKEVEDEEKEKAEREGKEPPEIRLIFDAKNVDKRRYNVPKSNEIAAVIVLNENNEVPEAESLVIHQYGKQLKSLSKFDKKAESMLYPIYFPTGKGGWEPKMKVDNDGKKKKEKKVTLNEYYRFMTAIRFCEALRLNNERLKYAEDNLYGRMMKKEKKLPINAYEWNKKYDNNFDLKNFNPIRLGGKLFQQYTVDAYVKVEQDRLDFIRTNQTKLKAENYSVLKDYLIQTGDNDGKNVGKSKILPATFKGSPRDCHQSYQDMMSLVRRYGKPDLFITFTCNPNWPEIKRNLQPGNESMDEPDLIDRVFKLKVKEMIKDIVKREIFGKVTVYNYVIEFQKRGLPHAHILVILDKRCEIKEVEQIDNICCSEIPDEKSFPRLHEIVTSNMIHGPCGQLNMNSVCMEVDREGKKNCSRDFPKEFKEITEVGGDSYVKTRRRDNGVKFTNAKGIEVDNRWVVPYNKYLLLKYAAHINVEICATIKCVKYLYKYVYKGHDCARIVISDNGEEKTVYDEVKKYVDTRYVTPHEAFWRILEFKLEEKSHSVKQIPFHLPNQQIIYYKPGDKLKDKLAKAESKNTMLTAWFELNKVDPNAKEYYYYEIPEHYTFKKKEDSSDMYWGKKGGERGIVNKPCIGRMYTSHPKQGELFYLRMLLLHVRGVEEWKDLLTVEGEVFNSFEEAARKRGLIEDHDEWKTYFEEAVSFAMPKSLRELFVAVLTHGENLDVKDLWETFKENMYEDFVHQGSSEIVAENMAKVDIERQLQINGSSLAVFGIELPVDIEVSDQEVWNREEEREIGYQMKEQMNEDQRKIIDYVFEKINEFKVGKLENGCIYIDGPGGSGKTYTYQTLCHLLRAEGIRYKTSCWMGIAANLMLDGRTMHKNFGLPFDLDKHASSNAKPNNKTGKELKETEVFIIDEISMVPKHALEMIDRKLRELNSVDLPFGGRIMILGGDLRQILPIQRRAGRDALICLSVTQSCLWNSFKLFKLSKNQRVLNGVDEENEVMQSRKDFAEWLLKVGDGNLPIDDEEYIEVPEQIVAKKDLIEETFGEYIRQSDLIGMSNRVILTTTNERARDINDKVLNMLEGSTSKVYYSYDKVDKDEPSHFVEYPPEFLHSLNESGLTPHELKLKVNCPVILKRNLNPAMGLCNGTRLRVKLMHRNMIECEIMFGPRAGKGVLIPRITLTSAKGNFPFTLYRKQFPVQLCFGMAINKSRGQTLEFVGLDMEEPVFAHGMTYVGLSRVSSWDKVKVAVDSKISGSKIKNIVWKEVSLGHGEERNENDVEMIDLTEE